MRRAPKTPQEKKRLSLQRDRRNTYGENDKASRKLIPLRKAKSRRAVRRRATAALDNLAGLREEQANELESTLTAPALQKGEWRKVPDTALGDVIANGLRRRAASVGARNKRRQKRADGVGGT